MKDVQRESINKIEVYDELFDDIDLVLEEMSDCLDWHREINGCDGLDTALDRLCHWSYTTRKGDHYTGI